MHRITLLLILFLLIPDVYIYFVYIVRKTKNTLLRCSYWLPTLLLAAGYIYLMYLTGDNAMSNHTQGIGRLAIVLILFIFPKTIFMLCSLIGVLIHFIIRRCPRSPFTVIGLVLGIVSFFNILYGTIAGITRFEIKETEFYSNDLPKGFDGYRIVQISDIHIGSWHGKPEAIKRLVNMVNEQKPDLIVFTGDLVNQQSHELDGFQDILSQLHAPDGVYSILGNHDYGSYYHWKSKKAEIANLDNLIQQQKAMGWKLLNNEHDILYHNNDSIALIGVENDGEPPFSQFADLRRAIQGTEGMFQILLSHNPTHWRREVLPDTNIPLMLAGHTHAMQGILFGHSLAELIYPEWRGMYNEGNRALYVNIGIGYVGLPFRFGAWPEITVLTLRK
ncbi:metallophosphoesterase [uncultured Bacteroides sp.]|uniref:metallophosphoesterase n=1 Tax=uncultured Bacteroides sp. TaxID=162156 RepID=UPI0025E04BE3|nr:metallophosphoesterase [uncultured Bacteroides sp.]